MTRVFLLSPANASGKRGQMVLRRWKEDAPIGELYSFVSGLYFRGKLAYATAFAAGSAKVIVAGMGLVDPSRRITREEFIEIASIPVDESEPRYREPLLRDAAALGAAEVVLLGSIATDKYVEPLVSIYGDRVLVPREFVGRGDMSRGALMLRCAASASELEYVPVSAVRKY